MGLRQERKNSLHVFGKNNDGNVKDSRRNSMGNTSGIMSSMAKIRQNMLESPHFLLKKEDASNKSCVLSENKGLGRATVPQVSKYDLKLFEMLKNDDFKQNLKLNLSIIFLLIMWW